MSLAPCHCSSSSLSSSYYGAGVCPAVKAFEYYPDGTLKRVELKTAADYPRLDWRTEKPVHMLSPFTSTE